MEVVTGFEWGGALMGWKVPEMGAIGIEEPECWRPRLLQWEVKQTAIQALRTQ